jgi:hypothetical protein
MSKKTKPTMPALACLSYDRWIETFNPKVNTITANSAFDGMMFETYGDDLAEVLRLSSDVLDPAGPLKVWTIVENDDGDLVIVDGYHRVNRMGYMITDKPADAGVQYVVTLD